LDDPGEQALPFQPSQPFTLSLSSSGNEPVSEAPVFVEARLTELAGPGLRMETSLHVQPGDRVLVVFTLDPRTAPGVPREWGAIAGIGRVRHCRVLSDDSGIHPPGPWSPLSVAVELVGLSDAEIDELAYVTAELSSGRENRPVGNQKPPADTAMVTAGAALDQK
jgi:hypothetical protein